MRVTHELRRRGQPINQGRVQRVMRQHGLTCRVRRRAPQRGSAAAHCPRGAARRAGGAQRARYGVAGRLHRRAGAQRQDAPGRRVGRLQPPCHWLGAVEARGRRFDVRGVADGAGHPPRHAAADPPFRPRRAIPEPGVSGAAKAPTTFAKACPGGHLQATTPRLRACPRTVKVEAVHLNEYAGLHDARRQLEHFLDAVYNHKRLHSALGYCPPQEVEAAYHLHQERAASLA